MVGVFGGSEFISLVLFIDLVVVMLFGVGLIVVVFIVGVVVIGVFNVYIFVFVNFAVLFGCDGYFFWWFV